MSFSADIQQIRNKKKGVSLSMITLSLQGKSAKNPYVK